MRLIKFFLLSLLLLAGFIYINELYISELWNFNGAYFRTSEYHYFESDKEREDFIDTVVDCCSDYEVCVFACSSLKRVDTLDYRLTLFADVDDLPIISSEFQIKPGKYYSLFSGSIDVVVLPFEKLKDNDWRYVSSLSFCGESDGIKRAYDRINELYSITYPQKINGSDQDMAFIVWGIITVLSLLLTGIYLINSKKEICSQIIFGYSPNKIVLQKVIVELLIDGMSFILAFLLAKMFVNGFFMLKNIALVYAFGVFINNICYLSIMTVNPVRVLSNAFDSRVFLKILIAFKIVLYAVIVISLTSSFDMLFISGTTVKESNLLDFYENYSFVSVRNMVPLSELTRNEADKRIDKLENIPLEVYNNCYESSHPVVLQLVGTDLQTNKDIVLANENTNEVMEIICDRMGVEYEGDAVIIIPKSCSDENTASRALGQLDLLTTEPWNLNVTFETYDEKSNIMIPSVDQDNPYGYLLHKNPILVWLRNTEHVSGSRCIDRSLLNNVLYDFSCENNFLSEADNSYEITTVKYGDYLKQLRDFRRRLISILTSVTSLLTVLYVSCMFIMINTKYRIEAKEIVVKKTLGYGTLNVNKRFLLTVIVSDFAVTIAVFVLGNLFSLFLKNASVVIGGAFCMIDIVLCMTAITISENRELKKAIRDGFA